MKEGGQSDLLSEFEEQLIDRRWTTRLIVLQVVTFFSIFLLLLLCDYLPKYLYETEALKINTFGLSVLALYITHSLILPKILNNAEPSLSAVLISFFGFSSLFIVTTLFKLVRFFVFVDGAYELDLFGLLKASIIIAILGSLITNIRIHKIRNSNTLFPIILFVIVFISLGFLLGDL